MQDSAKKIDHNSKDATLVHLIYIFLYSVLTNSNFVFSQGILNGLFSFVELLNKPDHNKKNLSDLQLYYFE